MDRYRIAPARPVCLSAASAGRRSGAAAEIDIFTAERYFSAADVVTRDAVPAVPDHHELPRMVVVPAAAAAADVASLSGRTAASSEASWNSRSALLSSGAHTAAFSAGQQHRGTRGVAVYGVSDRHHQAHRGRTKAGGGGQRWTLFGRDCPCAGRKAVTVDAASEPRSPSVAAAHVHARLSAQSLVEECLESSIFKPRDPPPPRALAEEEPAKVKVTVTPGSRAFPLGTPAAGNEFPVAAVPCQVRPFTAFPGGGGVGRRVLGPGGSFAFPASSAVLDEPPLESLEVFRSIDEDSVLADPPPPAVTVESVAGRGGVVFLSPRVPAPPVAAADEEAMSDASSDLFDLESFAASSSHPTTYRGRGSRRNSADDDVDELPYVISAAEPALSECMYPASEASVVWSVATAEGGAFFDGASVANFSTAASACCVDDLRYAVPESPAADFAAAMSRSAGRKKSGGGGFLSSCRCEKAVSVGPTPVRVVRPPAYPGEGTRKAGGGAARYHSGRLHVPVRT